MQGQQSELVFTADTERELLASSLSAAQIDLVMNTDFLIELEDGRKGHIAGIVSAYHSDWLARTYVSPTGLTLPRVETFDAEYAGIVLVVDAAITRQTGVSQPLGDALVKVLVANLDRRLREGMEPVPEERLTDVKAYAAYIARDFHSRREEIEALIVAEIEHLRLTAEPGDELWAIRSRYVGPLAGYRGYGLVRDGRVTKHKVMIRY